MDRVEATGRTVNEAIENALVRLETTRDQVDIEVIHEGSRGILGIGAEDARVVVTRRGAPPHAAAPGPVARPKREPTGRAARIDREEEAPPADATARPLGSARPASGLDTLPRRPAAALDEALPDDTMTAEGEDVEEVVPVASDELVDAAVGVIMELLELLHIEGEVEVRSRSYPLTLNIHGEDLGILIGRHGDTLASLQFIVNLILGRRLGRWTRVVVDVEEYRLRRERTLHDVAARAAERVRRTRQTVTLEPMPASERRIVHLALQGDRFVATHSIGEGDTRKVVISPRGR